MSQYQKIMARGVVLVFAAAMLGACQLPGGLTPPTAFPSDYVPTAVHLTALSIESATRTASPPTVVPSPTLTFIPPTLAPSATPALGPPVPLAALQVKAPGPMSRVATPLQVQVVAVAGDGRRVEIALYGEDGRLLGRSLVAVPGSSSGDMVSIKMPFETRSPGEQGFLQVSTKNGRGRVQSLITVPVLLLSPGESQINPPGNTIYERVALADLEPEEEITGGVVEVVGEILPYNRSPVIVELVSADGENLSLRVLDLPGNDWQAVQTTLPYRVSSATEARLFVHQADDVIDGPAYVFSQLLVLNP